MSFQPRGKYGSRTGKDKAGQRLSPFGETKSSKPASSKVQNTPLEAGSTSLESSIIQRKGLVVFVLFAVLVLTAVYYGAKFYLHDTFRHVEISSSGIQLRDAETNPEILEDWINIDLAGIPVRVFKPQFGYRMDFQQFKAVLVAGSMTDEVLAADCYKADMDKVAFNCVEGEIVAMAKIGDGHTLSVTDLENSGRLHIRGTDYPYSSRSIILRGSELRQIIVHVDSSSFAIVQMPAQNYSIARVMEIFSKPN